MNRLEFLWLLATISVPFVVAYKGQFDNIDVEEVLKNERLYANYFGCLKGAGKCTPDGKELKDILPEALATNCNKCTPEQKEKSQYVVNYIIAHKQMDYLELEKMYDPTCKYREANKQFFQGANLEKCAS